jgi:hypothetical protein
MSPSLRNGRATSLEAGATRVLQGVTNDLLNLTERGRYLNVSAERARQVAADQPTFPSAGSREAPPLEPRQGRAMG